MNSWGNTLIIGPCLLSYGLDQTVNFFVQNKLNRNIIIPVLSSVAFFFLMLQTARNAWES